MTEPAVPDVPLEPAPKPDPALQAATGAINLTTAVPIRQVAKHWVEILQAGKAAVIRVDSYFAFGVIRAMLDALPDGLLLRGSLAHDEWCATVTEDAPVEAGLVDLRGCTCQDLTLTFTLVPKPPADAEPPSEPDELGELGEEPDEPNEPKSWTEEA